MFSAPCVGMFRRRNPSVALLIAICASFAVTIEFLRPDWFVAAEHAVRDLIARHGRTAPANPDLVFLAIDQASISLDAELDVNGLFASSNSDPAAHRALEVMAKPWPWNREIYALILQRLVEAGAKVVAFDCLFPAPAAGDDAFRVGLERYKSQVVIGSNFVSPENVIRSLRIPSSYEPPTETLIPRGPISDDRVGFTNFFARENKFVRGAQYRVGFREHGSSTAAYLAISARLVSKAGHPELVPKDFGEHLFRFTGPPRMGFKPHSVFEIFVPEYWEHNYRSGELLRNKVVIVGAEGKWQKDEIATPLGFMPGAELHLNSTNAILSREFLSELPPFGNAAVVIVAVLVATACCFRIRSSWTRLGTLLAADTALPVLALTLFNHPGVYIPCLTPLFALNASVLFCFVIDFAFERIEKARLRSTLTTRDDLTNMIVHDLRSPLTIVTGYIEALKGAAAAKFTPTEAKFIANAQRGAENMRDMITTLLDVSRIEAGQMPLQLEPHDLREIAQQAAARFAPVLDGRIFHCDVPTEPVMVSCDAAVIRRVLENLINNALKFTKSNGTICIDIESTRAGAMVSVIDDGPGIPADQHAFIFEKFGQTASGAKQRHSTGLGLTFCRMAIEAHAGTIGVKSEPGKGSTFEFVLPLPTATRSPQLPETTSSAASC